MTSMFPARARPGDLEAHATTAHSRWLNRDELYSRPMGSKHAYLQRLGLAKIGKKLCTASIVQPQIHLPSSANLMLQVVFTI